LDDHITAHTAMLRGALWEAEREVWLAKIDIALSAPAVPAMGDDGIAGYR